jgi:hypothetical protein
MYPTDSNRGSQKLVNKSIVSLGEEKITYDKYKTKSAWPLNSEKIRIITDATKRSDKSARCFKTER